MQLCSCFVKATYQSVFIYNYSKNISEKRAKPKDAGICGSLHAG